VTIIRKIIRTDGTEEPFDAPRKIGDLCKAIGAGLIDTVQLRHLGLPVHVMLVDDNGWETKSVEKPNGVELVPVRARKPVNEKATALYLANCRPGTTHQIVGDVVVCPDDDFGGPL
jgi:hypothetical protein